MRSPCIKQCQILDNECTGCKRTLYEIASWSRLTDAERDHIMSTLDDPERVSPIKNPKRRKKLQ